MAQLDPKKEYLFYALVISRSGSLLYSKQFDIPGANRLDSDDLLLLASTFHAMHAISASVAPKFNNNNPPHLTQNIKEQQYRTALAQDIPQHNGLPEHMHRQLQDQLFPNNNNNSNNNNMIQENNVYADPVYPTDIYAMSPLHTQFPSHSHPGTTYNDVSLHKLFAPEKFTIKPLGGIKCIETKAQRISCLQTPTGYKFLIISTLKYPDIQGLLYQMYVGYSDVIKNPFYTIGMPIRFESFEKFITNALSPTVPTPKS